MSYPSIISQPGSADRNFAPILEAIRPWIARSTSELDPTSSSSSSTEVPTDTTGSTSTGTGRAKILEIGSYPYAHIRGFAREFPHVQWYGSGRDDWEIEGIKKDLVLEEGSNLHPPVKIDIASDADWEDLRSHTGAGESYKGVVMLNVVHCCPEGAPENVFRQLASPPSISGSASSTILSSPLLEAGGWVAVYGPYLADDGTYKSPGDEEFDRTYIRAKNSRLGLRTVGSITAFAEKWGFEEVERREMPKGNMWVVWQLKRRV